MKAIIDKEEWYPVYTLELGDGQSWQNVIEITEAEYADYERIMAEFYGLMTFLRNKMEQTL